MKRERPTNEWGAFTPGGARAVRAMRESERQFGDGQVYNSRMIRAARKGYLAETKRSIRPSF